MAKFATLSDDYVSVAVAAEIHFRSLGYTITKEKQKLGFPYTPALTAKRRSTTVIVEVGSNFKSDRAQEWVAYCKSIGKDNRIAFATRKSDLTGIEIAELTSKGIGIYTANGHFDEVCAPRDIALHLSMPNIKELPIKLRRALGPVYEKLNRNEAIDAFEEACIALETLARPYLWKRICGAPPAQLLNKGRLVTLTKSSVERMTLGALGTHFGYIVNMNHADSVLSQVIPMINGDRIKVAHKKHQHSTHIRRKAGQNLWSIVAAMKVLC